MTFADLMSLLLAFFVLLFSFSELDKEMYKQVAGSMRDAFGVQRTVKVKEPPKGVNVIASEFSPGMPRPTALNEVRQFTTDDLHQYLKLPPVVEERNRVMQQDGERIHEALKDEIEEGLIELDVEEKKIVIRIRERGAFGSGQDRLIEPFRPVLERMAQAMRGTHGQIVVSGHTDNVPISNERFRSNWDLSAARGATVVHELIAVGGLDAGRLRIEGYADTQPIDENATEEGRARNRRVEVAIVYGSDEVKGPMMVTPEPSG